MGKTTSKPESITNYGLVETAYAHFHYLWEIGKLSEEDLPYLNLLSEALNKTLITKSEGGQNERLGGDKLCS
jgi:hypothetical protein